MSHLQTVIAGLLSHVILENTEGKLERKCKILDSEYDTDLDVSRLHLKVLRVRDFLVAATKGEGDMTMMTKSSAVE